MLERKRLTLADVFRQKEAEVRAELAQRQAYEATPEGRAEAIARDAFHRRMAEADERFAAENTPDRFQEGKDAALANEARRPPDDLADHEADQWLEGWDSEGPNDG